MAYKTILLEKKGPVALITLNRPEALNALNEQLMDELTDALLALEADGVHLGQRDLPPEAARSMAPPDFIVGVSTNSAQEARRAKVGGASYVAIGSIFSTGSKAVTRPADPQRVREVKATVDLPVVAIGGIDASNIDQVLAAGADAVAVISAVCAADDVRAAARELAGRF